VRLYKEFVSWSVPVWHHDAMRDVQIKIGTFTRPVLVEVARRDGSLERAGLDVVETSVTSSPAQFQSLEAGDHELIFTSPDNVIAYRFVSDNPLGRTLSVEIVGALDRGLGLSLCLGPSITSVAELRGRVVGVDVPQSGFAFVAYELLRRAGLTRDDYTVTALGSTPRRASALIAGECAATVLNAGNELRAAGAGCTVHSTVNDIGPYLGTVMAALVIDDPERIEVRDRFMKVMLETAQRIVAGERADAAIEAAKDLLDLTGTEAQAHYRCLLDPANGFIPTGRIDRASISTLLDLRRRYLPTTELDHVEDSLNGFIAPEILD
jgi:ABC-type nitrate/sulfonate/bicarbonate transport system substrate-binding protein